MQKPLEKYQRQKHEDKPNETREGHKINLQDEGLTNSQTFVLTKY
jgi:hypothetical protein